MTLRIVACDLQKIILRHKIFVSEEEEEEEEEGR